MVTDKGSRPSPWRPGYKGHHLRPSSRGGNHSAENVVETHEKSRHQPYHRLFFNLWPHEAAILLFFSWATQHYHEGLIRYDRKSLATYGRAWDALFENCATPTDAYRYLAREFATSKETRCFMSHAESLFNYAENHNVPRIEGTPVVERAVWAKDAEYVQLFTSLYPHEAILLVLLAWKTVCPHQERMLPLTLCDDSGNLKDTFVKRTKAWDTLIGPEAGPWEAVDILEQRYGGDRRSPYRNFLSQAKDICRRMERSGLLQR